MSGLKFLYNLILKDAIKGSGKASGIMSIGPDIRKITMNKYAKYVDSAKRQNVDLNKLSEQEIKYMLEMNKPKGPTIGGHRVIDASSAEGKGITEALLGKRGQVIKGNFGKPFAEEVGSVDGTIKYLKTLEPMDAMKETNKVLKGDGRYKSLSKADRKKIADDESVTDHIFERDIPIDPEDMAGGGVAGLLGERPGYSHGNGVADGDAEKAALGKRVRQLMDEGFDFGEAVRKAMSEGYADGGRIGFQVGGSPKTDARMQNTREQNIKNIGDARLQNTRAQNIAINEAQRANNLRMRGMGNSGFQTQPGTLNQGTQRIQNIVMNQAPNRFADYLSGRTEPVTNLSEIASTQSTRDALNQGILGSLERNQVANPMGAQNFLVKNTDYDGYKLGEAQKNIDANSLTDFLLKAAPSMRGEIGQFADTMLGNPQNQIANTLGDYTFQYKPPSYDFDDDYMGIKDKIDFPTTGVLPGSAYDVNVELTDADTKQKIREQLFKDAAAEPSAMPQGSPGQLNPTPTPDAGTIKLPQQGEPGGLITDGGNSYKINEDGMTASLVNQKPTMADVAGPAATGGGYAGDTNNVVSEDPLGLIQQINKLRNGQTPSSNYSYQPEEGGYVAWDGTSYSVVNPEQIKRDIEAIQGLASGGRARQNFAFGRRAFLKLMGGVGAGIAGLKSGLLGFGKGGAKKAVTETVKQAAGSGGQVPPYFLNLVKKIKNLGDDVTPSYAVKDRQKVTKYKEYELTEDVTTGKQEIQRMKVLDDDSASYYGQPLTEETYMSYTPGENIVGKGGKPVKTQPEYEEGTALLRSDRGNAGDIVDESATISDDVIKEGTVFEDTLSEFGKADGGRIGLWLGGGLTAGKGLTREMLKFMAKGSSHGKTPSEMLKMLNPKQFEKILNEPKLTNKFSKDTGIMASDMVKDMIKKTKTDRTDMIEQLISSARSIKKGDDNIIAYKNKIIEEMVSKGMNRKTAEEFAENLSKSLMKEVGPKGAGPKVTEQGLLELENIQKNLLTKDRQLQATGGRVSLSGGGLAGMLGE